MHENNAAMETGENQYTWFFYISKPGSDYMRGSNKQWYIPPKMKPAYPWNIWKKQNSVGITVCFLWENEWKNASPTPSLTE